MKKEMTFKDLIERVNLEGIGEDKEKGLSCYNLISNLENKFREILRKEGFDEIGVYSYNNNIVLMNSYEMLDKNMKYNWKVVRIKISKTKKEEHYNWFNYETYYSFKEAIFDKDNIKVKEDMKIVDFIEMVKEDYRQKQLDKDNEIRLLLNNVKGNNINVKEFLSLVDSYNKLDYNSKNKFRRLVEEEN